MENKYQDIIHLEHPTSSKHPRMNRIQRAAQFAPFAALTGHDQSIKETARLTDYKIPLSDEEQQLINQRLAIILSLLPLKEEVFFAQICVHIRRCNAPFVSKSNP